MKKFSVSFEGLLDALHDKSIFLQCLFALAAVIAGMFFQFNHYEWIVTILMIGFVISAEIFNTCIEKICDFIQPDIDLKIKRIKDLSSAAVLVSAISALIAGILIVLNHI